MRVMTIRKSGTLGSEPCRAVIAALAGLLVLAGCDANDPIKIGFIGGLSGRSTDIGLASRNAVQMAVEDINRSGGLDGRTVELLVQDDADEPDVAAQAVRDLVAEGVVAIVGPNNSSIAAGMLPAINELRAVTISPTASSLVLADIDDFLFRINWTTRDNAQIYAKHYAGSGIRRVSAAIDAHNSVFSESWLKQFREHFERHGGTVVATDRFDARKPRGYSDTARALMESEPQAVLMVANSVDTAQLAQQIRKLDSDVVLIAAEWAASERLLQLGGAAIEGLELVQSYNRHDLSDPYQTFLKQYRERFNQEPGYSSIAAYDAATMLFAGLAESDGQGGKALKRALLKLAPQPGLQQSLKFNEYGDARRQAFFMVVRDGRFVAQ